MGFLVTRLGLPAATGGAGSGVATLGSVATAGSASGSVAGGSGSVAVSGVGSGTVGNSADMSISSGSFSLSLCLMAPFILGRLLASKLAGGFTGFRCTRMVELQPELILNRALPLSLDFISVITVGFCYMIRSDELLLELIALSFLSSPIL